MTIKQRLAGPLGKAVTVVIAIPVVLLIYLSGENTHREFIKHVMDKSDLTSGTVTNIENNIKLGTIVRYKFTVGGDEIDGRMSSPKFEPLSRLILAKTFPVIYSKTSPDYNKMLILPEDYKDFNVAYPDSLRWVLRYFDK